MEPYNIGDILHVQTRTKPADLQYKFVFGNPREAFTFLSAAMNQVLLVIT